MQTMKKFLRYLIMFIALYLVVTGLIYIGTFKRAETVEVSCEVIEEDYNVKIDECVILGPKGKVKGAITNNTEALKKDIYIQINLYNEKDELVGNKKQEIKYFNVGETNSFEIEFKSKDVYKVTLEVLENENS